MHIGTLIYCFPVQGDRHKANNGLGGRGGEEVQKQQWGAGRLLSFSQQCSPYRVRAMTWTGMNSQTRGAQWVQKCSRADQWVALLRGKKSQLNTVCRQRPCRVFCFLPNTLGRFKSRREGKTWLCLSGVPHVLWGWWMPSVGIPTVQTWEGLWGM